MSETDQALGTLQAWFYDALGLLGQLLGFVDGQLEQGLARTGVPPDARMVSVLVLNVLVIVVVARLFAGPIRALLIVLLVLLLIHGLAPRLGV